MPDTPTPGQVCYEAYMATQYAHMGKPFDPTQPGWHYRSLERRDHRAWDAAAQAVLALKHPDIDGTGFAPPGTYRQEDTRHA